LALNGIGGGSKSIETLMTGAAGLEFADAMDDSWAGSEATQKNKMAREPNSVIGRKVGFDNCVPVRVEKSFAC